MNGRRAILLISVLVMSTSASADQVAWPFEALPYAYDALEPHIDAETMEIHHDRHHRGYFNNLLTAADDDPSLATMPLQSILADISGQPVNVRNNAGGHYNHTLFWNVMSPEGGGRPEGRLANDIDRAFGSFDGMREEFNAAARSRFGSGWAWLSVADDGSLFVSSTPNQDNPLMDVVDRRGTPILGLDVWEHAYYLKYQNQRGSYIEAFWNVVDWPEVADRYLTAID